MIRFIFSSYNLLYFRNFKVVGRENIPQNGGVLYSPNHQNALIDPLLVGTTATASIYSLTRSDVFGGPLQWFLDAMQTLPVYRIRDGYDKLKKNKAVFERCHQLLSNKENLMMFSEGKHHEEYYLLRLSKGSARLAMKAQLQSTHPIYIQPVGLNYGNHLHPRHDCTVVYGNSINLKEKDILIRTCAQRLRPVFLTSFTTVVGLLPLASSIGVDFISREVGVGGRVAIYWQPLAFGLVWGLSFATILTLFCLLYTSPSPRD